MGGGAYPNIFPVRYSEWTALLYFLYLAIVSWARPLPVARRVRITLTAAAMCGLILAVARQANPSVRDWAPGVYILVGYYVSGWLFSRPSPRIEAWLIGWDRKLLGDPATRFARWPRWFLTYLDVVYMFCFLLVPAGVAILAMTGHSDLSDRYWTMVAMSELGSFAPLGFIQTRPPWAVERTPTLPDAAIHRAAARFIRDWTIGVNTFPSGHVAGSLTVAFAVIGTVPLAGAIFLLLAISITIACIVGRYHYIADAAAGAVLALMVTVLSFFLFDA